MRNAVDIIRDIVAELQIRYNMAPSNTFGNSDDTRALLYEANELKLTLESREEYRMNMYDLEGAEKRATDLAYKNLKSYAHYSKASAKTHIKALADVIYAHNEGKALEVIQLIHDITGKLIELDYAMAEAEAADTLAEISQPREDVYAATKDIEYYCNQAGFYAVD